MYMYVLLARPWWRRKHVEREATYQYIYYTCLALDTLLPSHLLGTYLLARDGRHPLRTKKCELLWASVGPFCFLCALLQESSWREATNWRVALPLYLARISTATCIELICNRHPHGASASADHAPLRSRDRIGGGSGRYEYRIGTWPWPRP